MKEVPPCVVSSFVSFTSNPSLGTPSHSSENTFGCISRNGTWSWIARGSLLEVFNVQTKERCAACCFGAKSKSSLLTITAIEEFSSTHLSFPCLLIGLETSLDGGLLCVFNVKTSKVISAIQLPYKVTSLTIVSSIGGATMETYMLNKQLRYLFGIAAVGTEGGNILLVDLCLDAENYSDEMTPNKATILTKTVHNLPAKREVATSKNQHICILLNDNNSCDTFEYRNSHTLLAKFSSADVIVSALKYIRNLAVLVVGFNFGGIQLWNLQHLTLEISIPVHSNQQPLVHFAFQEPENDPRNFCYVWAIRGHYQGENYRPENASIATLYALSYGKRDWIPRYGYFYERLQGCTKRFEYALTSDPYNSRYHFSSNCSRLISCDVISQSDLLSRLEIEDPLQNEEWGSSEDFGLCLMAWENWPTTGEKPSSSYLALFDINQWYQAQMPSVLRCNYGEMCSYLGVFSLKEVSKKMNLDSLLGVSLAPNSLSKFKSLSMAEETFFPSSVSFKIWCLSMKGILHATYLGVQRQLLAEMNLSGPNILLDPKELYKHCLTNGLLNHLNVGASEKQLTVAQQRENLLTLALDHSMIQFLSACVQSWRHIEYIQAGCSSKFLLDWVWKVTTEIKTTMDNLCQPLFNCSGQALDENTLITLHVFKSRLKYLSDVLTTFQSLSSSHTEQGLQELQLRKEIVESLSVYLHVLMWLYDCKLLPEHPEGDEYGEDEVAYPITLFSHMYSYRRSELQKIHSSICESDLLLVDGLVEEFGDSLIDMWEKKGGSRNYPPPSLYAAVSSYLIDGVTLSQKHMLMYYILLDIAAYLSDRQSHLLEKLSVFCLSNGVSLSVSKLTQAFWHLDHQEFEVALTLFVDPVVLASDITRWQHVRIIRSFLYQDQPQMALKYISVRMPPEETEEEIKLHLSVLLANRLIGNAFMYLRQNQNETNVDDLLHHMFLACQQTHCLDDLLQLPLVAHESIALCNYLCSCSDPKALEVLIMYHLLHCQPLEALGLNERLNAQVMERGSKSCERAVARNALVNGFVDTLPAEQRKLAQELNQMYSHIEKHEVNSKPLSASVTCRDLTYVSYADMLKNIMDKFSDSVTQSNIGAQTPFRSWKPSVSTSFIRPSSTPSSRKRKQVSEIVPSPVSEKSSSARIDCNDYSTPLKKARSFDIRSFKLTDSNSRTKSAVNENLLSLLQTPPVNRLSSAAQSSKISSRVTESAPLSILKTKFSSQQADSSTVPESLLAKTPSVCSEISRDDELSDSEMVLSKKIEDSGQSRHLRFQMPSTNDSIKSLSVVTPRRPLHEYKTCVSSSTPESESSLHLSGDEQYFPTVSCFEGTSNTPNPLESMWAKTCSVPTSVSEECCVPEHSNSTVADGDSLTGSPKRTFSKDLNVELINNENSNNPEVSFGSISEGLSQEDHRITEKSINSDSECSFKSIQSEEGSGSTPMSSKLLHEYAKTSEHDLNPIYTVPEDDEKMETDVVATEVQHSPPVTPEKQEASHTTTHYLRSRSRSRSKSASPARTPKKSFSESPIYVPLFTASEADYKESLVPNVDSMVPLLEAEIPQPRMHTPERNEDSHSGSPGRVTRSRSRSKSASPSRLFAKSSPKAIMPRSIFKESLSELDQKTNQGDSMISVLEAEMPHPGCLPPEDNKTHAASDFSPPYCGTRSKSISPSRRIGRKTESDTSMSLFETDHVMLEEKEKKNEKTENAPFASDCISPLQTSKDTRDSQQDVDLKQSHPSYCEQNPGTMQIQVHESSAVQTSTSVPESANRPEEQSKKIHKVTGRKQKIVKKKNSKSVKTARKLKFNFSNPHSSADSEILEALSTTPNTSIASFVFSPPASRTRTRQKQLNETLNSTSIADKCSDVTSDASLDSMLHDDTSSKRDPLYRSSRQKKKPITKLKESLKQSDILSPRNFINFISPVPTSTASPQAKSRTSEAKHSMVLRKTSKKTMKLF